MAVRCRDHQTGLKAVRTLIRRGFDAGRLWLGGLDWAAEPTRAAEPLRLGATAAFDRLFAAGDETAGASLPGNQLALVASLARSGYAGRLLLGSGIERGMALRVGGGDLGLGAVIERIPLALMEGGVEAIAIRQMLVEGPARILTIGPEA